MAAFLQSSSSGADFILRLLGMVEVQMSLTALCHRPDQGKGCTNYGIRICSSAEKQSRHTRTASYYYHSRVCCILLT